MFGGQIFAPRFSMFIKVQATNTIVSISDLLSNFVSD